METSKSILVNVIYPLLSQIKNKQKLLVLRSGVEMFAICFKLFIQIVLSWRLLSLK